MGGAEQQKGIMGEFALFCLLLVPPVSKKKPDIDLKVSQDNAGSRSSEVTCLSVHPLGSKNFDLHPRSYGSH